MKELYAVIGNPIAHSMSPVMHNDLFDYYGIDAHYHAFQVKEKDLKDAVNGMKALGVKGFNVTVPHKVAIMPLLDEIDDLARAIGAVNTVVNNNGKFIGYNTDGMGYVKGLLSDIPSINNKNVLLIGAGGAARAIYFTLAREGVKTLDIANQTISKAENLRKECPYMVNTKVFDLKTAENRLKEYDIIIQTTNMGMSPKIDETPLSLEDLRPETFVSDIIYNPLETKFLKLAKEKGAPIQNGLNMFVYQGALAFEKWTGIFPDIQRMKKKVLCKLGGSSC